MLHSERRSQPLVRTDIYLSEVQRDALKRLGAARDLSMAEVIRRVLDRYIRRELKKQRAR
jgi:hypothetical protein